MKALIDYLKEEQQSVFSEIKEYVLATIDYLYNEGVTTYDDKHLVDYSKGKQQVDFNDLIKTTLNEYKDKLSQKTQIVLSKYLKNGSPKNKKSVVENAVLAAIEQFVKKGNCEKFV